jgi:hypothetical protein
MFKNLAADGSDMTNYYSTLELIGDAALSQQLYTIAAKKYTEANNRMKVCCFYWYSNFRIVINTSNSKM